MKMNMSRRYDNTLRAKQATETEQRIVEHAERMFATELFDRVSLGAVADAAGVTIPTVQRRFGTKDGLLAACGARIRARVHSQRGAPPVGDLARCIHELVAHYEVEGAMVWHLLRQEADVPLLHDGLEEGRSRHRAWVEAVFGTSIKRARGSARRARIDALVAVTDVFVWKLLRLDLGRSRADVEQIFTALATAVSGGS